MTKKDKKDLRYNKKNTAQKNSYDILLNTQKYICNKI